MENLTLKLKGYEVGEFANAITGLLQISAKIIDRSRYFHFYNLRSLWKKCGMKYLTLVTSENKVKKNCSLKVNINEFESLLFYAEYSNSFIFSEDIKLTFDPYYQNLIRSVINSLDKQRRDLSHYSNFVLPK